MPGDKGSRVIFIGNIPYGEWSLSLSSDCYLHKYIGLTEEQIIHMFGSVGQVLNFRLVYDKDTGRPKGFGFLEFSDVDAAASAVRNMNDHEIMGRRLRVDYSNDGGANDSAPANYTAQVPQPGFTDSATSQSSQTLPPLPAGADLPAGLTCPDAISRTLSTLPAPQLLDILSQMKGLVMSDPMKATELLRQAPQLSYAIFQSLLLLGLVDTSVLATVVDQTHAPPQPVAPQYPPQSHYPPHMQQMNVPTPSVMHGYPHPPLPQQAVPDGQAALLRQVMAMTQQQIDAMPPLERSQILALRQQLMGQMGQGQYA